jgi:hypothetical protein
MTVIPISEALRDGNLLGAALGDITSWRTWCTILKAAFAEPLSDQERELFAQLAGDRSPPSRRVRELWCGPIGRRSGKSRMAAAIACHVALLTDHKRLAPGETGVVAIVARNREQAGVVFGYVKGFLQASSLLAGQVENFGRDEITLRGGIRIGVITNSFRSSRGMTLLAVIGDEIGYWDDESLARPDVETFRAVLPSLIASGGMWVGISSGYRRSGLLFEKHRDHFGRDNDDVLAISGSTQQFNPLIDRDAIAKARDEDPELAEAEWDGGFRRDVSTFLSDHDIDAAVDHTRPLELGPRSGVSYIGFVDPSGGRHDAYAVAIGHVAGTRTVLDVVRSTEPPFDPHAVTQALTALLKDYGLSEISGDCYSSAWVEVAFRDAGINYIRSEKPKSALYLEAAPLFARGVISLPNHPTLLRELRLLERRTHRSGRDTVDHAPGGHDDCANATLGVASLLSANVNDYDETLSWVFGAGKDPAAPDLQWQQQRYFNFVSTGGYRRPW